MPGSATMMTGADIQALKDYVSAPGNNGQNQSESTVRLHVTHSNLKAEFLEIRLNLYMTVDAVKQKLMTHCGSSAADMVLQLKDERGRLLQTLSEDHRPLGYYSPYDGCGLHVVDTNPLSVSSHGWLEDTSKVQKYVMSDAEYSQRDNTYRKYKEQMRQTDPDWTAEKELAMRRGLPYQPPVKKDKVEDEEFQAAEAAGVSVGSRCEVDPGAKRGTVRFVGKVEGLPLGYWVGVEYDEPVGKNDGSIKGRRYFQCMDGYGGMVRPGNLKIGDFPAMDDEFNFSDQDEI